MDNLISEFISESGENLRALDADLAKLEKNPGDLAVLGRILRTVHTIKGTCGFLGLPRLEAVAKAAENALEALSAGKQQITPQAAGLVLQSLACIRGLIDHLSQQGQEASGDDSALIARLNDYGETETAEDAAGIFPDLPTALVSAADLSADLSAFFRGDDDLKALMAEFNMPTAVAGQVEAAPQKTVTLKEAPRPSAPAPAPPEKNTDALERLTEIADELAETRRELMHALHIQEGSDFLAPVLQLPAIAFELKETMSRAAPAALATTHGDAQQADFLLFAAGKGAPKALPLELVVRLERIDVKQIETAAGLPVVQYRGDLLRLVCMNASTQIPREGVLQTIVLHYDRRTIGLVVDRIIDIASAPYDIRIASAEKGLLGSMLIAGKATDLVDVAHLFGGLTEEKRSSRKQKKEQEEIA